MWKIKFQSIRIRALACLVLMSGALSGTGMVAYGDGDEKVLCNEVEDASDPIFDPSTLHRIEVTMNPGDLERIRMGDRNWFEAETVIFDRETLNIQLNQVGIKARAVRLPEDPNFITHPTMEFDFSRFREEQTLLGLHRMGIRSWSTDDKSLLVQQLGMRLFCEFGLPAPRVAHARVFIDGEYIGPYVMEDRIRLDDLVPRYFPLGGNFYKMQNTSLCCPEEDLPYYDGFAFARKNPDDPASYLTTEGGWPFEPRGGPNPDGSDLLPLIRALNQPTSEEVRAEVSLLLDVDDLIDYLAVDMSLPDTDGLIAYIPDPRIYFENNTYFYHNPETDKFNILPDDVKAALDAFDPDSAERDLLDGWETMNITKWLLNEPDLLEQYFQRVRTFVTTLYTPDRIVRCIDDERCIDRMASVVRPAVDEDKRKPITIEAWDTRIEELKHYVRKRARNLRRQLREP